MTAVLHGKEYFTMKKRVIAALAAIVLLISLLPLASLTAFADPDFSNPETVEFEMHYSGTFTSTFTSKTYKITLPSSGRLKLDTRNDKSVYVYLYDSSRTLLWDQYVAYDSSISMAQYITETDLTGGVYYLVIEKASSSNGRFGFTVWFTGAGESFAETGNGSNNSLGYADTIQIGTTYTGQIAINDTVDYYKIVLPSSGRVCFTLNTYMDIDLELYSSSGTRLWYDWISNSGSSSVRKVFQLDLTKSTYYFAVKRDGYNDTGVYTVLPTFLTAGESFTELGNGTNNTFNTSDTITAGKNYYGQFALNDSIDYYRFSLSESGHLYFTMSALMDLSVRLYDGNKNQLWSGDLVYYEDEGKASLTPDFYLNMGDYYICFEEGIATGTYQFFFQFISAEETFSEAQGGSNNSDSTANTLVFGRQHTGFLSMNDSIDVFKVTVSSTTPVRLVVASTMSLNISMYKDGTRIWYGKAYGSGGETDVSFTLTDGTYCFRFEIDSADNYGQFFFTLDNTGKPKVTSQPKNATVALGASAAFSVTAENVVSYQWQYRKSGETAWTNWSGKTQPTLTVVGSATNNQCQYRCVLSNVNGHVNSAAATLTVSSSKPAITTQPKSATVALGASATFKVVASGSGLKYQWEYKKAGESSWSVWSGKTAATLTVTGSNTNNGCQYRCKVSNAAGSVTSSAATLTVTGASAAKPAITTNPAAAKAALATTATFKVVASGTGLSYQWQYSKDNGATWTSWSGKTQSTLSVKASTTNNGCLYRCKVSNSAGSVTSSSARLTVTDIAPTIVVQPKAASVALGKTATMKVVAAGSGLTYQWQYSKDGGATWHNWSGKTAYKLEVTGSSTNNGCRYRCVVKNSHGSVTSASAKLTVT